jgi:polyisoprenoid-binding protein YceI
MQKTKWVLDPTHSEIGFKVKHMMMTNVNGSFNQFNLEVENSTEDFITAQIHFALQLASIDTSNEQRDGHLLSADFFDAENHPEMVFKSTEISQTDVHDYQIKGDLTIKDITNPISLKAEFGGISKDPWGNEKAGFSVEGKINRKDFGLTWNTVLESGGVLISEEVKIYAEIQLVKTMIEA